MHDACVECTGFFENAGEALSFLRFVQIPLLLDFDSKTNKMPFPAIADFYLSKYEIGQRQQIDHLLGAIDRAIISGTVTETDSESIRQKFNSTFSETNPTAEIHAWGTIIDTLSSPYFGDEADEDQELPPTLIKLLKSGKFSENNNRHLALARDYFTSRFCA